MITAIEIENPYRYRGFQVGQKPMLDIQNFSYVQQEDKIITGIDVSSISDMETYADIYTVYFEDGSYVEVQNCPGMIIHREDK